MAARNSQTTNRALEAEKVKNFWHKNRHWRLQELMPILNRKIRIVNGKITEHSKAIGEIRKNMNEKIKVGQKNEMQRMMEMKREYLPDVIGTSETC